MKAFQVLQALFFFGAAVALSFSPHGPTPLMETLKILGVIGCLAMCVWSTSSSD
jgi:hypothetical protein